MRIWFPKPLGQEVIDQLRQLVPAHLISREASADTEMIVEGRVEREHLEACPNLRWVVVPFAGVPAATLKLIKEFPSVSLHNLHHNAPHTAEMALALLFAAAKQVVPMDNALRKHDWSPRYTPDWSLLLEGKTCLILGYGEVGKRIGAALRAIGMKLIIVRRTPVEVGEYGPADLMKVLPQADVLMITIPLTQETQGMIGPDQIAAMTDNSILINIARAQIVDESSLFEALKSGKLHSAGLDVWYRYPQEDGAAVPGYFVVPPAAKNSPPANLPFHELRNLVMSPHRGGMTAGTETHRIRHLADLIEAAASGRPVPNRVDLELGY